MKNYKREIVFGIVVSILFLGLLAWFAINGSQTPFTIILAAIIILVGIITFIWRTVKKIGDLQQEAPAEDEFTNMAKVYAGNRAFHNSMWLWLLIFIFNSSFSKHETMLGIGILGSALIYAFSLWSFHRTGEFHEK